MSLCYVLFECAIIITIIYKLIITIIIAIVIIDKTYLIQYFDNDSYWYNNNYNNIKHMKQDNMKNISR